ncbi:MAG: hypothetical protein Q8P31_03460 [Bacillota bacterium]|nr:hypothetical protein [Bacillota bacterium]
MDSLPFLAAGACLLAAVILYAFLRRRGRGRAPGSPGGKPVLTREQAQAEQALRLRLTEIELERERRAQRHMSPRR